MFKFLRRQTCREEAEKEELKAAHDRNKRAAARLDSALREATTAIAKGFSE